MTRMIILSTGPWSDLPLDELAQKCGDWGYQGFELSCAGDHFEVQRAQSEPEYCQARLDLLARHDLGVPVLGTHQLGQAIGDQVGSRHAGLVPDYVWGDGDSEGVSERAAEEMAAAVRAAQTLGIEVVCGLTGSPVWADLCAGVPVAEDNLSAALERFAHRWNPILDTCRECGVRFAALVQPGQIAFDLASAELALDALAGRDDFGFTFDPSCLHWQGIDPVEFVRRFPDRIYHVRINDCVLHLNGRNGVLSGWLSPGDSRRGWDHRAPGRGSIDWEAVIRVLNEVGYAGPLAVDFHDPGMQRDHGAEESCRFVKRLDFEPAW